MSQRQQLLAEQLLAGRHHEQVDNNVFVAHESAVDSVHTLALNDHAGNPLAMGPGLQVGLLRQPVNIDEGFVVAGAINNIGFQLCIDQRVHRLPAGAAGKPGAFG
jgi:hypothetical protein